MPELVQETGFEPAKHYAQRPERCPFDRSGTPARNDSELLAVYQNGEYLAMPEAGIDSGAGSRIRTYEALRTGT